MKLGYMAIEPEPGTKEYAEELIKFFESHGDFCFEIMKDGDWYYCDVKEGE